VTDGGLEVGLNYDQILNAPDLSALWVVGANPLARHNILANGVFVVVQELFLTETARYASVVLPALSVYEKDGTVTNVCGDVQKLTRAAKTMGPKSDLEIIGLLAKEMRADWPLPRAETVFHEIRRLVLGYDLPLGVIETGGAAQTNPGTGDLIVYPQPELIRPAQNTLFTSGTLGQYSKMLTSVLEYPGALYDDPHKKSVVSEGSVQLEALSEKK
jgi:NADH-quinone oxidoreductase subunit G